MASKKTSGATAPSKKAAVKTVVAPPPPVTRPAAKAPANTMRALADAGEVKKDNIFKVDPRLLREEEDFNPRDYESPANKQKIEDFASAYAEGRYVPPVVVRVVNGEIFMIEGHKRRRGAMLAIERGTPLQAIMAVEFKGSDIERNAMILTSQDSVPLTPLEIATVLQRMSRLGATNAEIARETSRTPQAVEQALILASANQDVKLLVKNGDVAAQVAIDFVRKHKDNAGKMLQELLDKVSAETPPPPAAEDGAEPAPRKKTRLTAGVVKKHSAPKARFTPDQLAQISTDIAAFAVDLGGEELLGELDYLKKAGNDLQKELYTIDVDGAQLRKFFAVWELTRDPA